MRLRISWRIVGLVVALGSIASEAARGQGNLLVTNPDFDDGLAGWSTGSGQVSMAAVDADLCPGSFSFSGEATGPASPSVVRITSLDCVPVTPGEVLELEMTYRAEAPVHLEAVLYGGTGCSSSFLAELGTPLPAAGDWTLGRRSFLVEPANATAVRFSAIARIDPGPVSFVVEIDRAYLGRRYRIFADNFEGGATCRWSSTSAQS